MAVMETLIRSWQDLFNDCCNWMIFRDKRTLSDALCIETVLLETNDGLIASTIKERRFGFHLILN